MSEIQLTVLLRQLRKDHGYSQEYVAEKLHIVRSTYSHYETGRITPSVNSLVNLARLYAVPFGIMLSFITTYYAEEDETYGSQYDSAGSDTGCFFVEIDEIPDYLVFSKSCDQKGFKMQPKDGIILYYVRLIEDSYAEAILSLLKAMKRDNSSVPE